MTSKKYQDVLKNDHRLKIIEAEARLTDVIKRTSLMYSEFFSKEYGNNVYLKTENLQTTGSFKIRGAYNKVCSLSKEEKERGIIASSAGNHAQGVAISAQKMGIKSTIVMPSGTPLIKVDATKSYGSDVVLKGDVYDDAYKEAVRLADENGYTFVHPFDDIDVIYGQGTIGLEILDDLDNVDAILVPVGGGGLISGIALYVKSVKPSVKVIGVEPFGAAGMTKSLKEGKVVELNKVNTTAEGVAVKRPGELTYEIVSKYVDEIIEVSEEDITEAMLLLVEKHKLVAETAGLLPLAALKKLNCTDKNIACVISGGNIDVVTISNLINMGLVSRGRMFCFSVDLPDKPGQLLKVTKLLADLKANVIELNHNQFKATERFLAVQLEVTVETNGQEHINTILRALKDNGLNIKRIY